jgi:broad specificity phosphatase PhoE
VRHGITQDNINGCYSGQRDTPLTELGECQAASVGEYLATEKLDVILSSDLQRARNTARAIARYHHLPLLENPDLREISMGEWEGLSPEQIRARDIEEWKYVKSDPVNHAPPGGETYARLRERAARALKRCQEKYAGQTVLWAAHGELIGMTLCHALGLDFSYLDCFQRNNASVTELQFGHGLPVIVRLNDTSHLRSERWKISPHGNGHVHEFYLTHGE